MWARGGTVAAVVEQHGQCMTRLDGAPDAGAVHRIGALGGASEYLLVRVNRIGDTAGGRIRTRLGLSRQH